MKNFHITLCCVPFQEGVTDADVYPDIKFKLTYQIVKKTPPTPSSPTDVPSLVPYSVLDPSKPQEATALVSWVACEYRQSFTVVSLHQK